MLASQIAWHVNLTFMSRKHAFVGVILAQNKIRGTFTRENIELLQSLASQLGETLNNNVMYTFCFAI